MSKRSPDDSLASEQCLSQGLERMRAKAERALAAAGVEIEHVITWETSAGFERALQGRTDEASRIALRCLGRLSSLRTIYLERFEHLLPRFIAPYTRCGIDREDLLQEAALGLLEAMDRYDWRRGVRFSTYAQYWVRERVLATLYSQAKTVRLPTWVQKLWGKVSRFSNESGQLPSTAMLANELDVSEKRIQRVLASRKAEVRLSSLAGPENESEEVLADERYRPEFSVEDQAGLQRVLSEALESLSSREREVLLRRFGLVGHTKEALSSIAADLGLSSERVRQIQVAALERLRGHSRMAQFAECLS